MIIVDTLWQTTNKWVVWFCGIAPNKRKEPEWKRGRMAEDGEDRNSFQSEQISAWPHLKKRKKVIGKKFHLQAALHIKMNSLW